MVQSTCRSRTSRPRQLRSTAAAVLALLACSSPAWAIDYIWQGGGGNWADSGKWTLLGVPGSGDSATISFTGTSGILLDGNRSLDTLVLHGGNLGGTGSLTLQALSFNNGTLGYPIFGAGGVTNVAGSSTFNGTGNQTVDNSHQLHLLGNSNWTAGNGRLVVSSAYSAGNNQYPSALLRVAAGTTFTDEGAASSTGFKVLGGGNSNVRIDGTYTRQGLGTTWVRGLDNAGTLNVNAGTLGFDTGNWLNTSSGQVNVAAGAELLLAATTFTAGAVNNAGKVTVIGNDSHVQAAASISGNWQVNAGRLFIEGTQTIGALTINGGVLTGQGTLNVDQLNFNAGTLTNPSFQTGGALTVRGTTTFNGTGNQSIDNSHQLRLHGDSSWTAGNGRLIVASAYSAGNASYPAALLQIGSGTTFTDQGAASQAGFKVLGGGTVRNDGTLVRTGLGTTEARGLDNAGHVDVVAGTLEVDERFRNTGTLTVRAGAVLHGLRGGQRNDGLLDGDGTVRTVNLANALINAGTITPGALGTAGSLLLDGDLAMAGTGTLRIDLVADQHDLLTITSDASFAGTLQLWAAPGTALHVGDSIVVATYDRRLGGSSFGNVQWLGTGANPFSVVYGEHALTLQVTSAMPVPEPAGWALMLAGGLGLHTLARRRSQRSVALVDHQSPHPTREI